jgi:hypothetical protein
VTYWSHHHIITSSHHHIITSSHHHIILQRAPEAAVSSH